MANSSKAALSSLIAQRLADPLVGRAVRSPKFQAPSYDKSTSAPFVTVFPLPKSEAFQFVRR